MRHLGRKEEQKRKQLTPMMRTLHQLICRVFGAWFASQNLQYERQNELAFQVLEDCLQEAQRVAGDRGSGRAVMIELHRQVGIWMIELSEEARDNFLEAAVTPPGLGNPPHHDRRN